MDSDILDPDSARDRMTAWKSRIDKLAADTQAMSTRLQGVRITAKDVGGLAEVTIDSTGSMVDLRLTERIQRADPAVVARTIMATLGDARSQLADRSQEIIADTVGTDTAAGRAISASVDRQLRAAAGPAPGDADEDYEDGFSFRRR